MPATTDETNPPTQARTTTGPRAGAQAGLDVLLTDAAVGRGTRRFIQPRAVAALGAGVARHPRSVARRASGLGVELARVAAGRSQQAPAKGDRRFADPAWAAELAAAPRDAGLPGGRRHRRRRHLRRRAGLADASARRASRRATSSTRSRRRTSRGPTRRCCGRSSTRAAPTSCAAARRFAADVSWPPRLPQSVDTAALRGRRQPRRSPRARSCCAPRSSSSSSTSRRRAGARGPAAVRPADDQQVLRPRPRARAQHGRVPRRVGPAGVRDLLAQPGRGAGPLRPRHLRRRGARGPPGRRRRSRARAPCTSTRPARAGSSPPARSATSPAKAARRRREPHAVRVRAGQRARRHRRRARRAARRLPPRSRSPPAAATWTARRSPACSRGCAQRPGLELRRQQLPARQQAAGLRRPVLEPGRACGSPPACTATSCASRSTTRWRARAGSTVLGSPVDLGARRRRQLHRRRPQRPHRAVGERLPQHAAAGRRHALRALDQRPHPGARQPAGAGLALQLPRRRRAPRRPAGLPRPGGEGARELVARLRGWLGSARATCGRRPSGSAAAAIARSARLPAPTSTRGDQHDVACPTSTSARHWRPTTSSSASSSPTSEWEHFLRTRRFVDEEVLPGDQRLLGARGAGVAAVPSPRRARPRRRRHRGLRLPGDELARLGPRAHGGQPRRREPGHVPGRAVRAGDAERSTCSAPTSSASAGFPAWHGSSRPAPSR